MLDEGHCLRTSGATLGLNFNAQTGVSARVEPASPALALARPLDSLDPGAKWMLTATPLVNSLSDLRWVCRVLRRPEWYSDNLSPNTFGNRHGAELGLWEPRCGGLSENGNEQGMVFTPTADPFKHYDEYDSFIHCTTRA